MTRKQIVETMRDEKELIAMKTALLNKLTRNPQRYSRIVHVGAEFFPEILQ